MPDSYVNIIIIGFLLLILYNLGAGLYYMFKDRSKSSRTVRALSWRIGLSLVLFLLLIIGRVSGLLPGNPDPITARPPAQQGD